MARPKKNGLSYFPLDVDFLEDNKIKILKARYGPDGIMLYVYLLCEIYKQGYYIQLDDDFEYIISEDLKMDQAKVKQVLNFLLSRSLFDNTLFQSDKVLTSAGIQRRFQLAVKERARKTPIEVGRFWLLRKEDTEPFIQCTLFTGFSGKNSSVSGNNSQDSGKNDIKKSKVNKSIYIPAQPSDSFQNQELEAAFQLYLSGRIAKYGELSSEQIKVLREELAGMGSDDRERTAIAKQAFMNGWKWLYPVKKSGKKDGGKKQPSNRFNNFHQREYDYSQLEKDLQKKQMKEMEGHQNEAGS